MLQNEYGDRLDRNGYAESLMPTGDKCFVCDRVTDLQRHEVYHGANREKSKRLGCWVTVCPECHSAIHRQNLLSVEQSISLDRYLKQRCQVAAQYRYLWYVPDFVREFGKNYLTDEDAMNSAIKQIKESKNA